MDDHPTLAAFAGALCQEKNMQTIAQMLEERGREQGLQAGLQKGRQTGLQEGLQKGRQEGLQAVLTRQLQKRFGELPAPVLTQIEAADVGQLERWADRVLDAGSFADVFR